MLVTFIALPYYIMRSINLKKKKNKEKIKNELKRYPRDFFGIRGMEVKRYGKIETTPCIYISNHQSHNDIFLLLDTIPTEFRFVAKKELFTNPFLKPFMELSNSYPLDREDPRQSLTLLKQAVEDAEKDSISLAIFPEGTRSHSEDMNEFKAGLFSIIRRSNLPIVPIKIHNSYDPKAKLLKITYGPRIEPQTYQQMKGKELAEYTQNIIEKM